MVPPLIPEEPADQTPNQKPVPEGKQVAVAIRGEGQKGPAIVASGRGKLAEQILQIAFERGIKVREDADLAEVLAALDLDSDIPTEAIMTVAEILNRVYAENAALGATTAKPDDTDGNLPHTDPTDSSRARHDPDP